MPVALADSSVWGLGLVLILSGGASCGGAPPGGPDLAVMPVRSPVTADPEALEQQLARDFISLYGDGFDELVLWPDHRLSMPSESFSRVSNTTSGIGVPLFDHGVQYGSTRLLGVIRMGHVWESADLADGAELRDAQAPLTILLHESGHAFSAHLGYRDESGTERADWLGRQQAHWSFFADTGGSPLGGNAWQEDRGGLFSASPIRGRGYCDFDLYAMGLLPAEHVAPMQLLTEVSSACGLCDADRAIAGVTVAARARWIRAGDVVAALGPRQPGRGPSVLRQAWIYLYPLGQGPDPELQRRLARLQQRWPGVYEAATRGLGTVATSLSLGPDPFSGRSPQTPSVRFATEPRSL